MARREFCQRPHRHYHPGGLRRPRQDHHQSGDCASHGGGGEPPSGPSQIDLGGRRRGGVVSNLRPAAGGVRLRAHRRHRRYQFPDQRPLADGCRRHAHGLCHRGANRRRRPELLLGHRRQQKSHPPKKDQPGPRL